MDQLDHAYHQQGARVTSPNGEGVLSCDELFIHGSQEPCKDGYVVRLHGEAVYCLVEILIILFFPSLTTHFSTVTHICHLEVTAVWAEKMEIVCIWITLWRISPRNPSAPPPTHFFAHSSLWLIWCCCCLWLLLYKLEGIKRTNLKSYTDRHCNRDAELEADGHQRTGQAISMIKSSFNPLNASILGGRWSLMVVGSAPWVRWMLSVYMDIL